MGTKPRKAGSENKTNPSVQALASRIAQFDTTQMTARELSELLDQPLYLVYAALLELGYTTQEGHYLPVVGDQEEPQPLYERIAQVDTSDMTLGEIAQQLDTTPSRARTALMFLGRFARRGGYKTEPRTTTRKPKKRAPRAESKPAATTPASLAPTPKTASEPQPVQRLLRFGKATGSEGRRRRSRRTNRAHT